MLNHQTPSILVVDEDHEMRKALVGTLAAEKFKVEHTHCAKEGLLIAERVRPDLIIVDLCLRNHDCGEMLKKFALMNKWIRKTNILLLIYLDTDVNVMRGLLEGEPEYHLLSADDDTKGLVKKVRSILSSEQTVCST